MASGEQRWTPQRRAVLEVVQGADDHPTATEVYERVRLLQPGVSFGTVYRALGFLLKRGELRELEFGAGASRFDGAVHPHSHVRCLECGSLADVSFALTTDACERASRQTGYEIRDHRVEFEGLCPTCRSERGGGI